MRALLVLLLLGGCSVRSTALEPRQRYVATAVGRLDTRQEARQLVAEVDGRISRVLVSRGEAVRAGQSLVEVACAPRMAATAARAADLQRSAAVAQTIIQGPRAGELAAAKADRDAVASRLADSLDSQSRAEGLRLSGFVTLRELGSRANAVAVARAELQAAQAKLGLLRDGARPSDIAAARATVRAAAAESTMARAQAGQCTVRSPIAGSVLQVLRQAGEYSGASQGVPLVVVGDLSSRMVRAEVNERDAASATPGRRVELWIDGSGERYRGRIVEVAGIMGRRSARSLDPTDRFDRDVREALIAVEGAQPPPIVGLRIMVGLLR